MPRYEYRRFGYTTPPELSGGRPRDYKVAIVGAGPIGLALAIDLALKGVASVVLDDNDVVSIGSRAICWAKRTLEIFDRLGVGERMVEKGITWKVGRVYHRDRELYAFDLLPEAGHKMPAFINLQQYYVEQYLVDRARDFPELVDLRFKNNVIGIENSNSGATIKLETPDGTYNLAADYVVACDGARSPIRSMLGLEFRGQLFEERFLIADIEMQADFPADRRFWFEPTFHEGESALLHKQPDDIYRIDLQLGWDADPEEEKKPEKVIPRIKAIVGERPFEIDWVSVYTFQCSRLERFVHGRVIFAGDSAHVVSPFGARGGNGGIQDVDALGWRLAAVVKGEASEGIFERYNAERVHGADENIKNSARTTNFMTPKSDMEKMMRRAVLDLAAEMPFARRLINSGRLSVPCSLERFYNRHLSAAPLPPGRVAVDAPLEKNGEDTWLLSELDAGFTLVSFGGGAGPAIAGVRHMSVGADHGDLIDRRGFALDRYGTRLSYLFRPDQHICAVFRKPTEEYVRAVVDKELGR
ncbi:FAD-dependent oxidoreductase [Chelativorans salis]|uniref:FAD-dependent oxidoreductase n=1 Tax=Chelativorans salis TaxID=2978478 RepID=A0ABT2LIQ1_9HYPH|nr:FAD-dependent oxidoreductase [Chelativorans sp. EGI FJ00035]MCT7374199.1 FAD-dependent oxidoreductase [Chelativorans sp. EGI FJ00035]